jgi:hypothetical protein
MGSWHGDLVRNPELISTLPKVMCVPIGNIFREIGLRRIDVWVLDVEGAELEVLHGLDFSKVEISTIVMECDGGPKDPEKVLFLSKHGYECQRVSNRNMFPHSHSHSLSLLLQYISSFCYYFFCLKNFRPLLLFPPSSASRIIRLFASLSSCCVIIITSWRGIVTASTPPSFLQPCLRR